MSVSKPPRMKTDEMRRNLNEVFGHYVREEDEPSKTIRDAAIALILQHYWYQGKGKDDEVPA